MNAADPGKMRGIVATVLERPAGPRRPLSFARMSIATILGAMGVNIGIGVVFHRRRPDPQAVGRLPAAGTLRGSVPDTSMGARGSAASVPGASGPCVMRAMPVPRCGRGAALRPADQKGAERRHRSGAGMKGAKGSTGQDL